MSSCTINRILITKNWPSKWFSKKSNIYGKQVFEDLNIRKIINNIFYACIVTNIEIERGKNIVKIVVQCVRFGLAINKKNNFMDIAKKEIFKMINLNISINIKDHSDPDTNAYVISRNILELLKKRFSFRKITSSVLNLSIKSKIKGARLELKGRINGNEIARKEWHQFGSVPRNSFDRNVEYAFLEYVSKYGVCSIKTWIFK